MSDPQTRILSEVENPRKKRNDIALSYALCIHQRDSIDWPLINAAIIGRWSLSGLTYIKQRAWKELVP